MTLRGRCVCRLVVVALPALVPGAAVAGQAVRSGNGETVGRTIREARALRLEGAAPEIDGRLTESVWQGAPVSTSFVQNRPSPGRAASARSEAMVLIDDVAVYVGMRLYDDPDSVAGQLTRRDAPGTFTDWAHVLIDSYHDRRTAFRFSVTPRGAKKDVLHFNDGQEDLNWDAVWDVATSVDSLGWVAEFRIPLSQLRFSAAEGGTVWGVNFGREIARYGEWSWWSPVLPTVGGLVSQSGELHDLGAVRPPRRLEVIPYTLGRLTAAPSEPGNPFYSSREGAASAGGDVRFGVGSSLTLSATINPDFGQVEADPSVVNLSAFETFYPDKRPFFTEGANLFAFDIGTDDNSGESLFYSRRVGRAPQRSVRPADGWSAIPDATTILGAVKLSGRTAGGWSIGILDAVTAEEEAKLARPGADEWSEAVEPRSNYAVVTLGRDFRQGRSTVGIMGTAVNRDLSGGAFDFLRSAAYVAGVTGRHRFAVDTWEASGYLAGSHIRGSENAIVRVQRGAGHYFGRPDAEHVEIDATRTSLSGMAGNVWIGKRGGEGPWRGGFGGHFRTPGLEVNDIGFQNEADQALAFFNLRYHLFQPKGIFRSFSIGLNPSAGWTFGGERMWTQIGSNVNFDLTNLWNGGWWMARRLAAISPAALRGGPAVHRPGGWQYSVWLNSDRRRPLTLSLNGWGGREDETGSWNSTLSTTFSLRPTTQISLALGPSIGRTHNTWQYLGAPQVDGTTHWLLGQLDQTTVSLTTRVNYTISPTLSFELYAQPFISGGEYTRLRTLGEARDSRFERRFPRLHGSAAVYDGTARAWQLDINGDGTRETSVQDPDFNFRQMRGNAVLRWEYRPGSTLYLVWGQQRTAQLFGEPGEAFALGRDARRLFNSDDAFPTPVTNVFLIKLSYWINP